MGTGTIDTIPPEEEIMKQYRLVATEGGDMVDILNETATKLGIPMLNVQKTVCETLRIPQRGLKHVWIPSEIDR